MQEQCLTIPFVFALWQYNEADSNANYLLTRRAKVHKNVYHLSLKHSLSSVSNCSFFYRPLSRFLCHISSNLVFAKKLGEKKASFPVPSTFCCCWHASVQISSLYAVLRATNHFVVYRMWWRLKLVLGRHVQHIHGHTRPHTHTHTHTLHGRFIILGWIHHCR